MTQTAQRPAAESAVRLSGLVKRYGDVTAVAGVDLEIADGEFFSMLGPSGSGKTTTLRMIAGFEKPTEGSVVLGGRDVTKLAPFERDVNTVFQDYALFPHMTVGDNVAYGLVVRKVPKAERQKRVGDMLDLIRLAGYEKRKPGQLSGGQRQRVAMGRALARDPKLFLFDEPLSNLDAKLRVELRAEIKLLHQRTKTTTVYVTHDQIEAMTLGDRIAVMKDGRVLQLGTPDDIYARPATRFVAQFIGSPAMNMLEATRTPTGAAINDIELPLSAPQRAALAKSSAQSLTYGLRPEAVQFASDGVAGTLRMTEPTGPETYATVETPVGALTLRVPGYLAAQVGETVHLQWAPEAVHLFDAKTEQRIV